MSLINDALKRAHLEAAQQPGKPPGALRTAPSHMPRRSGRRGVVVLVASTIVVVAVSLVLLVPFQWDGEPGEARDPGEFAGPSARVDRTSSTTEPETSAENTLSAARSSDSDPTPRPPPATRPPETEEVPPVRQPLGRAAPGRDAASPTQQLATRLDSEPTEPRATPRSSTPPLPAAEQTDPLSQMSSLDGKIFLRKVRIPGGGRLELSGVASGLHPVAVISGKVLSPGEQVEGFTVVSIRAGSVELTGAGVTFSIRLH